MIQVLKEHKKSIFGFRYLLVDMARLFFSPFHLIFRQKKIFMGEKYDLKGGALIVSNHRSILDPLMVRCTFWKRRIYYLAGEVVMDTKLKRFLLNQLCLEIDRNISDIEAIRNATYILKKGYCLSMFPEGGLKEGDEISSIKSGAILMAMQAKVPIIPVYYSKQEPWYRRQRVVIGEPFVCSDYCDKKFPSMKDMNHMTEELLHRMQELEHRALEDQ